MKIFFVLSVVIIFLEIRLSVKKETLVLARPQRQRNQWSKLRIHNRVYSSCSEHFSLTMWLANYCLKSVVIHCIFKKTKKKKTPKPFTALAWSALGALSKIYCRFSDCNEKEMNYWERRIDGGINWRVMMLLLYENGRGTWMFKIQKNSYFLSH